MKDRNTPTPFRFPGTPCLVVQESNLQDRIILLPRHLPTDRLAKARNRAAEHFGNPVFLLTGEDEPPPPGKPCYRIESAAPTTGLTDTDESLHRRRWFEAWHCFHKGCAPLGKVTDEHGETLLFLRLAHESARRNHLLALPEDGDELLRRLAWHDTLQPAWEGGWLRRTWRAWLAEVAIDCGLLDRETVRSINRLHGINAAQPGATTASFGQLLEKGIPDLFAHVDRRILQGNTRETLIRFNVA